MRTYTVSLSSYHGHRIVATVTAESARDALVLGSIGRCSGASDCMCSGDTVWRDGEIVDVASDMTVRELMEVVNATA